MIIERGSLTPCGNLFPQQVPFSGSALVSISQTDVGHLTRITQCSILYRYITDVHENRTPFSEQRTERIDFWLSKE